MRGHAGFASSLLRVLAGVVLLAIAPSRATEPRRTETAPAETAPSGEKASDQEDGTVEVTLEEALQLAVQAAEAMETADADARSGLLDRIRRLSQTIRDADPANPWLDYVAAYVHVASGRNGDAIESLASFLDTRDGRNYWRSHRLHGDLLVNRYPRLARASYTDANALKANEPSVLYGLARCVANLGDNAAAIEHVTNAIVADENETIAYTHFLAQLFVQDAKWSQALSTARQAVAMAERKLVSGGGLRVGLERIDGELALAVSAASGLMRAEPENEAAYLAAAELRRRRSDNALRAARLDELDILSSGVEALGEKASAEFLDAYAVRLAETGQNRRAIAAFEKLLLKDPANVRAADWLVRLRELSEDDPPTGDDKGS